MQQVDWLSILSLFFPAGGGVFILCAGAFLRRASSQVLFAMALASAVGSGLSAVFVTPEVAHFAGMVGVDGYARFFYALIAAITAISLLFGFQYARERNFSIDEFYALVLFSALGMDLVAGAVHWVIFFLGLELLSVSLYVLIAIRKGEPLSNEASLKYFILGAVASGFLAFGIAVLYAVTGKMMIAPSLATDLPHAVPGTLLALGFLLVGIGFKVSAVPFHLWTPDVYQGAPAPVTAFLSTGSKLALFAAFARFCFYLGEPTRTYLMPVICIIAALTMAVGNIAALRQTRIKRLLAYSSIAQMGYLFMALPALGQDSFSAIMFYLAVYAVTDLGAFGTVALLSPEDEDLDKLEDYQGLGYSHPRRAAILGICLFSLAGLPPTEGFVAKVVLFRAVMQAGYLTLAVFGMLTVIISVYYYLKVIVALYMRSPERERIIGSTDFSGRLACGLIFTLVFWLGIFPSPLLVLISNILASV